MDKKLPYAKNYKDLLGYQKATDLACKIFELTKDYPKEETYSLTDQVRRSSRSVGAQIAEAWGKRLYVKHFISKITDASAELNETEHWLDIAFSCGYLPKESYQEFIERCHRISSLLGGMISKAELFCERTDK